MKDKSGELRMDPLRRNNRVEMNIGNNTDYTSEVFSGLDAKTYTVQRSTFEDCRFVDCDFSFARITECRFNDCEFRNSNLSSVNCDKSKFIGSTFGHCKATGVNWTTLDWSGYRLGSPISFESCDISFSVFNSLVLRALCLRDCRAHDVDFSECDLEGSEFCRTDFQDSKFSACRLDKCNFRGATNYLIDPLGNSIEKAQFNLPEVLTLLSVFGIEVE